MQNFNDNILYKIHQHKIVLFMIFMRDFLLVWVISSCIFYFISEKNYIYTIIFLIVISVILFLYRYFFWVTSYFLITNKKIAIRARSWLFSRYNMSIYYDNIKDIAYSKNNVFHYMLNYWTFFARSSAWAWWDFEATNVPDIAKVYKIINYLYILPEDDRKKLESIDKILNTKENIKSSKEEIIETQKNKLLWIKWIKEVTLLEDTDKKYIFENEEDRNHWIYETIRKKVVFCFTHDSDFRDADAPIVLKLWNKTIFPATNFHEIEFSSTTAGSPWLKVHKYLSKKYFNLAENDATVLVGFYL